MRSWIPQETKLASYIEMCLHTKYFKTLTHWNNNISQVRPHLEFSRYLYKPFRKGIPVDNLVHCSLEE